MVHCHMSGALYRPHSDLTIDDGNWIGGIIQKMANFSDFQDMWYYSLPNYYQLFMSHHIHIRDHDIISP
jgi:hypothetical protein